MRRKLTGLAVVLLLLTSAAVVLTQEQPSSLDIERIKSATVFVMQARDTGQDLIVTCVGSGTLVSRRGLILTNAHHTLPGRDCPGDTLLVAFAARAGEPPIPKFRAEVVQADVGLDLALLQIARQFDGQPVQIEALALPFVELADSGAVNLDDTLVVVGYPGIGDEPAAEVRGTVSGFIAEPSGGDRAWIKTRAAIQGSMSGGGAYNLEGKLIGIPTSAPAALRDAGRNCRPIQDSNRDGLINANDVCIPVGGFINALRPSNLARPLMRAALLGLSVEPLSGADLRRQVAGPPTFERIFFAPSVVDGMPTTVSRSLPSGSTGLYLFFDYKNMTPETVYELRVTVDGEPNQIFSLAPVRWSGGERGLWYIGTSGQPLPGGVYEFTLVADGVASETKRLVVGGAAEAVPTFSNIVFGLEDLRGNVLGNGYVLPTGNTATARFVYRNMSSAVNWTAVWYFNGVEQFRTSPSPWTAGEAGAQTTSIQDVNGLPPGNYRLELYLDSALAATADFLIAGAQEGAFPKVFSNLRFVAVSDPSEAPGANAVASLPGNPDSLSAVFDWQQIARGVLWTMRWSVDGDVFYERTAPWSNDLAGRAFVSRLIGRRGIPDGTYTVDLLINNVRLASTQVQVGIGQLPIDRFAQAGGVQLQGQVLDADTRRGVPGAALVLLSADFSIEDFTWDQSQVYALAVTDRRGRFRVDRPLEFGSPYSVLVAVDGYLPVAADGFEVSEATENPLDITIELTRG